MKKALTLVMVASLVAGNGLAEEPKPPVWILKEYDNSGGYAHRRHIQTLVLHPIVKSTDRQDRFTLNLENQNPEDHKIIKLIEPGTGLDSHIMRDAIGSLIAGMPCQQTLRIKSMTQIARDIDRVLPNVKDKRRIHTISVDGCFEEQPEECFFNMSSAGAVTFGYGELRGFLSDCKDAMVKALDEGKPLTKEAREAMGR